VKIQAQEIIDNLHFKNGTPIIPPGSVVYVSTDDPDGLCVNCYVQRKPCTSYSTPKPVGCPEDVSQIGTALTPFQAHHYDLLFRRLGMPS
jgi:hypothetical protein